MIKKKMVNRGGVGIYLRLAQQGRDIILKCIEKSSSYVDCTH